MRKFIGNPKYVEQLDAHRLAIDKQKKDFEKRSSLCPQDKVAKSRMDELAARQKETSAPNNTPSHQTYPKDSVPLGRIFLAIENGTSTLNWTYDNVNQCGFVIQKSLDGINFSPLVTLPFPRGIRTYTDTDVIVGNMYWYYVYPFNENGDGENSNIVSTSFSFPPPERPVNLSVFNAGGTVILNWRPGSLDENYFTIERSDGGFYSELTTRLSGTTHFTDTPPAGITYWYRIGAVNLYGTSSYSDEVSITL